MNGQAANQDGYNPFADLASRAAVAGHVGPALVDALRWLSNTSEILADCLEAGDVTGAVTSFERLEREMRAVGRLLAQKPAAETLQELLERIRRPEACP